MTKKKISREEHLEKLEQADRLTDARRERIDAVVNHRQRGLMVLMEDVQNPHNLAAIARSCDAFGVQTLAFTVAETNRFDPRETAQITARSASKWLDFRAFELGTARVFETLKAEGWHMMVTVLADDAHDIYNVDFTAHEKLVIVVGNEYKGASETAIALADSKLYIPMLGMVQSFNVSVATAVTLFEVTRQRRVSPLDFRLPEEERQTLHADFVQRARKQRAPKKRPKNISF